MEKYFLFSRFLKARGKCLVKTTSVELEKTGTITLARWMIEARIILSFSDFYKLKYFNAKDWIAYQIKAIKNLYIRTVHYLR